MFCIGYEKPTVKSKIGNGLVRKLYVISILDTRVITNLLNRLYAYVTHYVLYGSYEPIYQ